MALGKRKPVQPPLFGNTADLGARSHPFYDAVNKVLDSRHFDTSAEDRCAKVYDDGARKIAGNRVAEALSDGRCLGSFGINDEYVGHKYTHSLIPACGKPQQEGEFVQGVRLVLSLLDNRRP